MLCSLIVVLLVPLVVVAILHTWWWRSYSLHSPRQIPVVSRLRIHIRPLSYSPEALFSDPDSQSIASYSRWLVETEPRYGWL